MEQGLLQALRKYAPAGQEVDPLENFMTEAFAWLLRTELDLGKYFLEKIVECLDLPGPHIA